MAVQKIGKKPSLLNEKTRNQGLPIQKRSHVLAAKVELTVKKMVEEAARAEGETVSIWIRDAIIKKLRLTDG